MQLNWEEYGRNREALRGFGEDLFELKLQLIYISRESYSIITQYMPLL